MLASCAKEGPTGPTGLAGPSFTGAISGHVALYDKYGSRVLTNLDNVFLSLSGNSVMVNPVSTTGAYSFAYPTYAVATGTFYITATDSAYAATTINNINFVSGTYNQDVRLSALPDSFLVSLNAGHSSGSASDSLVIGAQPDARVRSCIVFANSISPASNAITNYLVSYVCTIPAYATSITLIVPGQDLTNAGMTSGAVVYYSAYSYVVNDASVYEDLVSGKNVYNAVNNTPLTASSFVP